MLDLIEFILSEKTGRFELILIITPVLQAK